jgi:hypothetical protein
MNSDVLNTLIGAARNASDALSPGANQDARNMARTLLLRALDDVKIDADFHKRKDASFDGETFDPAKDKARLTRQLGLVFETMMDGRWRTLADISADAHALSLKETSTPWTVSEASISARLRDLRKPKFGSYVVERKEKSRGLYQYRLLSPDGKVIGTETKAPAGEML